MSRLYKRFFVIFIVVGMVSATAQSGASSAAAQEADRAELDPDLAEIDAIHAIYEDFLGRPASQDELDRFTPRLGVGQIENTVRAKVLASRAFLVDVAGSSREGFVIAAYQQVLGRAPTAGELIRGKSELFQSTRPLRLRREAFADKLLDRASYDPDGLGVRELVLHTNADGNIVRFAFELDEPFDRDDDVAITVSIKGIELEGTLGVRAYENIVSFIPDTPVERFGKIVGLVFVDDGSAVRIADMSTPSNSLPPRTVDEREWPEKLFEDQRIVAYYGNHISPLLGVLGETGPEAAVARVQQAAAPFSTPDKTAVGAFEMIVTVAQASAGGDGNYSHPSNLADVERWIDVAEENGLYVILDIQPGRSDFLTESKRYEELLKRPNVGLALDPEWRMEAWQRPGQVVGTVTAAEVNQVSAWLSNLVLENDLPEKMFVVHQFQVRMIENRDQLIDRPGLATVIHADGFGGRAIKLVTYGLVKVDPPFYNGFKLFIDEDTNIFRPQDVISFSEHPVPDLVTYQ